MTTDTYRITGMTCDHCARAVTSEISAIPGVTAVNVSVTDGSATVTSDAPLPTESITKAVTEAGYQLISAKS